MGAARTKYSKSFIYFYVCLRLLLQVLALNLSFLVANLLFLLQVGSQIGGLSAATTDISMILAISFVFCRSSDFIHAFFLSERSILAGTMVLGNRLSGLVLMNIIEWVSISFRTLSLGFRFAANSTAGHVISDILANTANLSFYISPILPVFWGILVFEVLVAIIQSLIFALLLITYTDV